MPRQRMHKEDSWLPNRVYRGRSSYEYRPKGGKMITLCRLNKVDGNIVESPAVIRSVIEAYDSAVVAVADVKNMDYYLTRFFISTRFQKLGDYTQKDYKRYSEVTKKPDDPKSRNGIRAVFGEMLPHKVKTYHIRNYMDYWAEVGKEVTANRHLSFLQTFFGWLRQKNANVESNPAYGVTKFKETSRAVYIEDGEYEKLLKTAISSSTPYVASIVEIAYLCGLRRHEVLRLNIEDITSAGLFIRRGKGSKNEITEISPRLKKALDFAVSLHSGVEPLKNRPLIRNTRGVRVSNSALNQAWRNIRKEAGFEGAWIHDMKKKAGTDGKDLGHLTKAMRVMYNLKPKVKSATK